MKNENRFKATIAAIDEINKTDPHQEQVQEKKYPKEYLYSQRMTGKLLEYDPQASEIMQIAARGQHIKRWAVPREEFPMDRKGYLKWRTQLKLMHADMLEEIMLKNGYTQDDIDEVKLLVTKKKLKTDPVSQQLEDVICLVFLEYYFEDFMVKHEDEKIVDILRKTWHKMTGKGHKLALLLPFNAKAGKLVEAALAE